MPKRLSSQEDPSPPPYLVPVNHQGAGLATSTRGICWWGENDAFIPDESPETLITNSSPLSPHLICRNLSQSQPKPARQPILSQRVLEFWFLHSSLELLITSQGKEALRGTGPWFTGSISCCLCTAQPNSAERWRNQCPDTGRSKYL